MYENLSYNSILNRMLEKVPDSIDKREGSIIMVALAPIAMELFISYLELDKIVKESFADTQSRDYLVLRAKERGLFPKSASPSHYKILCNKNIEIGTRFAIGDYSFYTQKALGDDYFEIVCEECGTQTNGLDFQIIPLEHIEGLAQLDVVSNIVLGEDEEDTESFRERYFDFVKLQAFGGNISDYKEKAKLIDGVGDVKVVSNWDGAGTVKLVVCSSENTEISDEFKATLQEIFDPVSGEGMGLAPIGHECTVSSATAVDVDLSISIDSDISQNSLEELVSEVFENYLKSLREKWGESEKITVRINQIESEILKIHGVMDVKNTKLNSNASNLILESNEIPTRGEIDVATY